MYIRQKKNHWPLNSGWVEISAPLLSALIVCSSLGARILFCCHNEIQNEKNVYRETPGEIQLSKWTTTARFHSQVHVLSQSRSRPQGSWLCKYLNCSFFLTGDKNDPQEMIFVENASLAAIRAHL